MFGSIPSHDIAGNRESNILGQGLLNLVFQTGP